MDRQVVLLVVRVVIIALIGGLVFSGYMGWREMMSANQLPFFHVRRQRRARGWRFVMVGLLLGVVAIGLQTLGIQAVERLLPATETSPPGGSAQEQATPQRTTTPTRPPQDTPTASVTPSPTERGTPTIPESVLVLFQESVTPDARAVFGPIHVARTVRYPAVPDDEVLESAEGILYGLFSYDYLDPGVRWTAVWLWEDEILCVDTKPWDGERGGWGYTECEQDQWPAGEYQIHLFLGQEWKATGQFVVLGPANQTASSTPTSSP